MKKLLEIFYMFSDWNYWQREADIEYCRRVSDRLIRVGWHCVEVYALPRNTRPTFYHAWPSWCNEYKSSRALTDPSPLVSAYYSDVMWRHQYGESLLWKNAVSKFTFLTGFRFLAAVCDGHVGFTCANSRMFMNALVVLVALHRRYVIASMRWAWIGRWRGLTSTQVVQ